MSQQQESISLPYTPESPTQRDDVLRLPDSYEELIDPNMYGRFPVGTQVKFTVLRRGKETPEIVEGVICQKGKNPGLLVNTDDGRTEYEFISPHNAQDKIIKVEYRRERQLEDITWRSADPYKEDLEYLQEKVRKGTFFGILRLTPIGQELDRESRDQRDLYKIVKGTTRMISGKISPHPNGIKIGDFVLSEEMLPTRKKHEGPISVSLDMTDEITADQLKMLEDRNLQSLNLFGEKKERK